MVQKKTSKIILLIFMTLYISKSLSKMIRYFTKTPTILPASSPPLTFDLYQIDSTFNLNSFSIAFWSKTPDSQNNLYFTLTVDDVKYIEGQVIANEGDKIETKTSADNSEYFALIHSNSADLNQWAFNSAKFQIMDGQVHLRLSINEQSNTKTFFPIPTFQKISFIFCNNITPSGSCER
jgi:hypothetical protein